MAKTATINMRVSTEMKADAESIFSSPGMTLTEAILHASVMVGGGLPFEVRRLRNNTETEAAMQEARGIMGGKIQIESHDSSKAMFVAPDE